MVDLKAVYRASETHTAKVIGGIFFLLAVLVIVQSVFSPLLVVSAVVFLGFVVMTFLRPLWTLLFLAAYLPFEPFLLQFVPDEIYLFARFFSEVLVYLLAFVVLWRMLAGKAKFRQTPLDLPFVLFLVVLVASALVNAVEPTTAVLGTRQILRFVILAFVVVSLYPTKAFAKKLTYLLFTVVLFQSALALVQAFVGAPLDQFLLPVDQRTFGDITLTSGTAQFWDPGSRVFATLGRYDRLGNFLYVFLLLAVGLAYEKTLRAHRKELFWVFALGLPALLLTYSRASWFAFLLGFLFIAVAIRRDKRVIAAFMTFVIVVFSYLALSGLQVRFITEAPGQTVVERFYESFSFARWRGEYVGLGRVFWFIQTPAAVVPAAPLFGHGPGMYGGGAAAALGNAQVYDELGLPFGVFGSEGHIDNNWFSLWGETGTLGIIFYAWMMIALFVNAVRTFHKSHDAFVRAVSIGFAALVLAVSFNAFTSTLLEIRTLASYFWLYAGIVLVFAMREKVFSPSEESVRHL